MNRFLSFAVLILMLGVLSSCGKKEDIDDLQPITMESLGAISSAPAAPADVKTPEVKTAANETAVQVKERYSRL